jgi:hypothetical protein
MDKVPLPPQQPQKSWKERLDLLQSLLTIAAILTAGVWFLIQGTYKPLVRLQQHATFRPASGKPDIWLVCFDVEATNLGKESVSLQAGTLRVRQMNPESDGDSTMKIFPLQSITLVPGETDQALVDTLYIPTAYKTLLMQSEYAVPVTLLGIEIPWKAKYIWQVQTPVDLISGSNHTPQAATD